MKKKVKGRTALILSYLLLKNAFGAVWPTSDILRADNWKFRLLDLLSRFPVIYDFLPICKVGRHSECFVEIVTIKQWVNDDLLETYSYGTKHHPEDNQSPPVAHLQQPSQKCKQTTHVIDVTNQLKNDHFNTVTHTQAGTHAYKSATMQWKGPVLVYKQFVQLIKK